MALKLLKQHKSTLVRTTSLIDDILRKLKKRKKKLLARMSALEKLRKSIRIARRSKQVSRTIGLNYRADTGDDASAPVFCVSNRTYMRHLRGYDPDNEQSIPTMTLEETQILTLISNICTTVERPNCGSRPFRSSHHSNTSQRRSDEL